VWESAAFSSIFLASSFSCSQTLFTSAHTRVTQTVETVEKVPFQKPVFEKWGEDIEEHLVFCILNNILAIFEPVVGKFV
jgi:hypothetical protein